ncbi:MAG: mannose-1-phosphate guanylyltransferase [Anaerolineales bacterium]
MKGEKFAVIMAGGGGTRLWPLSRKSRPKQMLPLIEDRTLFQTALQRLQGLFSLSHIFVVTGKQQAMELQQQAPELKPENFLIEPQPKGTAAAIGLAAAFLQAEHPGASMAVLTADHYIGNEKLFHLYLSAAFELAEKNKLVTLGIEPAFPATQYGYIEIGNPLGVYNGFEGYEVEHFKEKPEREEAKKLIDQGDHVWNSGMFIWKVQCIWDEFSRQMPDLHKALEQIRAVWGTAEYEPIINEVWPRLASQTIDYGVMEKAKDGAVIPAKDLAWNDVGSWTSLFEVLKVNGSGNLVLSEKYLEFDSSNLLIHSNGEQRLIVTVGVNDLVVVDTGDVLLICSRERAQDLRKVIQYLRDNNLEHYL